MCGVTFLDSPFLELILSVTKKTCASKLLGLVLSMLLHVLKNRFTTEM